MIRIENLHQTFGGQAVLRGVELEIHAGEVVALVGPSGTGKSVLLKTIVGLLRPGHGDVLVEGVSVPGATYAELVRLRRRMGYVFQDAALLDSLSIRENLRLALDDNACRRDPQHCPRRILQALGTVNLAEDVLDKRPAELSGGMRKRVGVARALMNEPCVLLYDEPTTGLDPQNVAAVDSVVLSARARTGATSVVVTHDMDSVGRIADRVVLLWEGRVRFDDAPAAFFASTDPVVRSFLGSRHPTWEVA